MLNENWKISTDSDHLFRHLTEVNGKDARGGYLEGSVWISRELLSAPLELKITLISSEFRSSSIKEHLAKLRIHPNLLYMTRFDEESVKSQRPRRQRELEARTPMWKIDLIIKDRRVSWFTESDAQPAGYQQPIGELVEAEGGGGILDLKMLHITVITPLQRTNATGIKIIDSLKFRRYMFEEVEDDEKWEKIVKEMEKFYAKEGKPELDRICLKFDLSWNGSNGVTLQSSLFSEHITNTKSKSMGAFDLSGEISISKTCCKLSRRVYIFSQFALPSGEKDKEVIPRFVVSPDNGGTFREDYRLKQPESFGVGKLWMWFETPLQAEDHVTDIYQENLKIYVEGYRLKDKYVTKKKIEFQYLHHMNEDDRCLCSIQHPDLLSSGPQTVEETLSARPGQKRRRLTQSSRSSGSVCKSPVSISSPANSERIQNVMISTPVAGNSEILDLTVESHRAGGKVKKMETESDFKSLNASRATTRTNSPTSPEPPDYGQQPFDFRTKNSKSANLVQGKSTKISNLVDSSQLTSYPVIPSNAIIPASDRIIILSSSQIVSSSGVMDLSISRSRNNTVNSSSVGTIFVPKPVLRPKPPTSLHGTIVHHEASSQYRLGDKNLERKGITAVASRQKISSEFEILKQLENLIVMLSVNPGDADVVATSLLRLKNLEPVLCSGFTSEKIKDKISMVCSHLNRISILFKPETENGTQCRALLKKFEENLCASWLIT